MTSPAHRRCHADHPRASRRTARGGCCQGGKGSADRRRIETTIVHDQTSGALTMGHHSRLCHFVIDCDDLDRAVRFWSAALDAAEEPISEQSRSIYRRLRLPDTEVRVLLQRTDDAKISKERMHLDIETNDVAAEVARLTALGARPWGHKQERGHDFWVMRDPCGNEFCVLRPEFPELLARRRRWTG